MLTIVVFPKLEKKFTVISHINFILNHHNKSKFALKVIHRATFTIYSHRKKFTKTQTQENSVTLNIRLVNELGNIVQKLIRVSSH